MQNYVWDIVLSIKRAIVSEYQPKTVNLAIKTSNKKALLCRCICQKLIGNRNDSISRISQERYHELHQCKLVQGYSNGTLLIQSHSQLVVRAPP